MTQEPPAGMLSAGHFRFGANPEPATELLTQFTTLSNFRLPDKTYNYTHPTAPPNHFGPQLSTGSYSISIQVRFETRKLQSYPHSIGRSYT